MLISMIGSPCSGKTTASAVAFANLKSMGLSVEFIPEQARRYIAAERCRLNIPPAGPLKLRFADQLLIMRDQALAEDQMLTSCGPDVMVITDSSPLNALLYMNEAEQQDPACLEQVTRAQKLMTRGKTLVFVSTPLEVSGSWDPLRVHGTEESAVAALKVAALVSAFIEPLGIATTTLSGPPDFRGQTIAGQALEAFLQAPSP